MSYYNTTSKAGIALSEALSKAKTQEDKVLTLLEETRDNFTASDVHNVLGLNCPLTSIRRALSTLKSYGEIVRLDITKAGVYGHQEYFYRLPTDEEECSACGCGGGPVNDDDKCINCR